MICRDCGDHFTKKNSNKGKINQCDDCSETDDTIIFLGFNDGSLNKSSNISIYKGDDPITRKKISNQRNRVH